VLLIDNFGNEGFREFGSVVNMDLLKIFSSRLRGCLWTFKVKDYDDHLSSMQMDINKGDVICGLSKLNHSLKNLIKRGTKCFESNVKPITMR